MAYKKYISKNGKIYGPYVYHSRRVNGKVVSEYRGTNKKLNYKKYGLVSLGILGLIILVFLAVNFISFDKPMTGFASLDLEADYQPGVSLEGTLKISLDEEELIPVSSKIIFKNAGKDYEYPLSEFIFEDVDLQEIEIYPEVLFTLNIISSSEEQLEEPVEETVEESVEEVIGESIEETPQEIEEIEESKEPILSITGNAVLGLEKQVSGNVVAGEEFIYNLEEGEVAEILSGSVKTDSKSLLDSDINLKIENNQLIVTTNYFEINQDKEYLDKNLIIDLSELNLIFEQGDLEVAIVYEDQEIVSLTTILEGGESVKEEVISEVKENLIEEEIVEDIIEEEIIKEIETFEILTDQEREILLNEFGEISVEVTKSEAINNRLIIRNELGSFWIEYSYALDLSPEELEFQIEADRIKWLKDIAKAFSQEEIETEEIGEFLGEVSI